MAEACGLQAAAAGGAEPQAPAGHHEDHHDHDDHHHHHHAWHGHLILARVQQSLALTVAGHLGLYLLLGGLVYSHAETHEDGTPWTTVDALYFTMATMSTVGYGDLSPSTGASRAFTVFMILYGVAVVFPGLATFVNCLTNPATARGRMLLERLFPQRAVDIDKNGEADYKVPRHPVIYYSKNMLPSVLLQLAAQLVSAAVFSGLEEGVGFGDAFYHCFVTATTVGYGDVPIATQSGRSWAIVHIMVSVCMLGELISTLDTLRSERAEQLARISQLHRRLDGGLLEQLLGCAKALRPKVERDGLGLTELEFAMAMLIELDIVGMEQVRPFIKQFRTLDLDGNGRLGADDLKLSRLSSEELQAVRKKTGGGGQRPPKVVALGAPRSIKAVAPQELC